MTTESIYPSSLKCHSHISWQFGMCCWAPLLGSSIDIPRCITTMAFCFPAGKVIMLLSTLSEYTSLVTIYTDYISVELQDSGRLHIISPLTPLETNSYARFSAHNEIVSIQFGKMQTFHFLRYCEFIRRELAGHPCKN